MSTQPATEHQRRITLSTVACGIAGACVGLAVASLLMGALWIALSWHSPTLGEYVGFVLFICMLGIPIALIFGVPAAAIVELLMKGRPHMSMQVLTYAALGGAGGVLLGPFGMVVGAGAAVGGKLAAEAWLRRRIRHRAIRPGVSNVIRETEN